MILPFAQRASGLVALSLGALSLALAATTPARAQLFGFFQTFQAPASLSPEAVYRSLTQAGYQPIGRIQRNGRVFLVNVYDPRRRQLRLVIDSIEGRILERYVLAARQPDEPARANPAAPPQTITTPAPEPKAPAKSKVVRQVPDKALPEKSLPERSQPDHKPPATAAVIPAPSSASTAESTATVHPAAQPAPAVATPAAAAAPAPSRSAPPRAETPVRSEGPGFANGVPINPLD